MRDSERDGGLELAGHYLEIGNDRERPLRNAHFERALVDMRPSTLEWLANARNHVEFANQSGRYDEVREFLVSKEARAWRD